MVDHSGHYRNCVNLDNFLTAVLQVLEIILRACDVENFMVLANKCIWRSIKAFYAIHFVCLFAIEVCNGLV